MSAPHAALNALVPFQPARAPRPASALRLLVLDPNTGQTAHSALSALPGWLSPGDLLVVNDAATLPGSLRARFGGIDGEIRLASTSPWRVVLFGPGDWRTPTEHRTPPPALAPGDRIALDAGLEATVEAIEGPRLARVSFNLDGPALWAALYRAGRPVQYSHLRQDLALWDVQTAYASRPWALEAPSAGLGLDWALLAALRERGVTVAAITHGAGLSATGEPDLDAALPLPERSWVPPETVAAVAATAARGGRVIAVGTSVARALEGNAARHGGALVSEEATIDLRIGPDTRLQVVRGLLTGLHEPGASHLELLGAFCPPPLICRAYARAAQEGYLGHEFGDLNLVLAGAAARGSQG